MEAFRSRSLEGDYPYVWLDALCLKVRRNHRIVSPAMVIAIGVRETGERDVLGLALGRGVAIGSAGEHPADMALPPEHWTRVTSTNPLERLNQEIKQQTDGGVVPDEGSVIR